MDPTKPSDLSGPSPISPQIKMPPPSQQSGPTGQPPPLNLPTKEGVSTPTPTPLKPPPASVAPLPQPDLKPRPLTPPTPPAGPGFPKATPPPGPKLETAPPAGGLPVFKSSIRTMQEDIAAIKKGQAPVGFQIEKQSEKDIKPTVEAPAPKITPPPRPVPEVKLGELEKAKPLPGAKPFGALPVHPSPPTVPPAPGAKIEPGLTVPRTAGINKRRLVFLMGALIVAAFLVWFFALRGPSVPEVAISPTPTYTPTPTPAPALIEDNFSIGESVGISLGANFTARFDSTFSKDPLISSREPGLYRIFDPATGKRYTLNEFLSGLLIQAPGEFISASEVKSFYLSVLYKSDNKNGYGFIVKLKDPSTALTALGTWEGTMTQDLKDFFQFDPTKAASVTFLDNTYQGVAIRYRNFPDPNLTIDYAVVAAKNGENYLVVTNSREHIYTIIDKIK